MTHRFPIKEIAAQAGLSTATIDRVINQRAHVSPQTRNRVAAAISELESQERQLSARGRRMFFDFVIEAPKRFSTEVRNATEQVVGQVSGANCRTRFIEQEIMGESEVVAVLNLILKRGSQGVCLKSRDLPEIRKTVEILINRGIPVITFATDVKAEGRLAYIGVDNYRAGRTAAYLVANGRGCETGTVLAIRSDEEFLGEEEREIAFAQALSGLCPKINLLSVSGGSGVHYKTFNLLEEVVDGLVELRAVYSMGGGNHTILEMLADRQIFPEVYVAHDLDVDNRSLIADRRVDYVLFHDLKVDILNVFHTFLKFHKMAPEWPSNVMSNVQVITPENVPN